jgi:competence protein ComEC
MSGATQPDAQATAGDGPPAAPDLRLAGAAIGAWLAALWSLGAGPTTAAALCAVAATLAVAAWCAGRNLAAARRVAAYVIAALAVGVAAGAGCCGLHLLARDRGPLASLAQDRSAVVMELVVRDDPRRVSGGPRVRQAYVIATDLRRMEYAGQRRKAGGRVLVLATDAGWQRLLPGQRVRTEGRLAPPRGGDLTAAVLSARGGPRRLGGPPWYQRAAGSLRAGLQRACAGLPPESGGLLPGLVVGDVSRMDPAVQESFQVTGMTHLTAVSGSNVAIVCGLVLLLARWSRVGPRWAALLAGLTLVGFVILVRPSPSVLRAALMGAIALVALAASRPRAALPALGGAVLLLVLLDPALARSPGFALSVCATAGLLLIAPGWRDALRRRGVPPGFAEALAVPAAAQAACAPVIAAMTGTISLSAIPANLLAVPAIAPATVLGVLAAVVSPVSPPLAALLAWLASWPARWLVEIAHRGSGLPGGTLPWPGGISGGLLLAVAIIAVLALGRWPAARRAILAVTAAVVLVTLPLRVVAPGWPPAGWAVVGCDVGQGDALVLRAGAGQAVVVDAGPDPRPVDGCLRRLGVHSVPLLVLTHPHADHVGGLDGVLRGRRVGAIAIGPRTGQASWERAVAEAARGHRIPVVSPGPGWSPTIGAVRLAVLGPSRPFVGTRSDPNNNSLVLRATVAGVSILLTGDAEHEAQRALLSAGVPLRADVLKVPHHGSAFSEPAFLDAVHPRVALVEVGVDNDYGHPNTGVLNHLRRRGARILRTDEDGDLAVVRVHGRVAVVTRGPDIGRPAA